MTAAPNQPAGMLEVRGLSYRFPGADLPLFSGFNLSMGKGDAVLVRGGSGTGKSTLLMVMAGLLEPAAGTVSVAGTEVHSLGPGVRDTFRGRHIGVVFQTFNLLGGFSAAENVMTALMFSELPRREHAARAHALLESLGLGPRERAAEPEALSVGQQQRVAVARALACRPAVVLADEPTAALDPANAEAAVSLLLDACKRENAALVCTSHDPAIGGRFERTVTLAGAASPGEAAAWR